MKCNLIVPGFAKSGTSSLHSYLDLHPNICMSQPKEPHYFSRDDVFTRGPEWHDSLFKSKKTSISVFGESSTSYSVDETPLYRIKSDITDPKLIILLRDPVDRLLSHYRWLWAHNLENRPLLRAVLEEEEKGYNVHLDNCGCYATYLRASRYSIFVPLMKDIFGESNLLLLNTKQLLHDPHECLNKCFSFLNVATFAIGTEIRVNRTVETVIQRKYGINKIANLLPQHIKNFDLYKKTRTHIFHGMGKKVRKSPRIEQSEIVKVHEMLNNEVEYFENMFT